MVEKAENQVYMDVGGKSMKREDTSQDVKLLGIYHQINDEGKQGGKKSEIAIKKRFQDSSKNWLENT